MRVGRAPRMQLGQGLHLLGGSSPAPVRSVVATLGSQLATTPRYLRTPTRPPTPGRWSSCSCAAEWTAVGDRAGQRPQPSPDAPEQAGVATEALQRLGTPGLGLHPMLRAAGPRPGPPGRGRVYAVSSSDASRSHFPGARSASSAAYAPPPRRTPWLAGPHADPDGAGHHVPGHRRRRRRPRGPWSASSRSLSSTGSVSFRPERSQQPCGQDHGGVAGALHRV